jgi:hypothetical protein
MSPSRRNLLIVLSLFWLLISWLIASLRPGADTLVIVAETLQIFLPGFFLITLLVSIEMMRAQKHTAIVRKDLFGGVDVFIDKSFLYIPFIFEIVARMPVFAARLETQIDMIDTRTPRLAPINIARVRCHYHIVDYKLCLAQANSLAVERIQQLEKQNNLRRTDSSLWPLLLEQVLGRYLDDNLRSAVWTWQKAVELDPSLAIDPFSVHVPRPPVPPSPSLTAVLENDPYDLSLNREKLSRVLLAVMSADAKRWGITLKDLVIEHVTISDELITRRTRNKDGEIIEAQHKAQLDYISIKARGLAEAEIRARTVRSILAELTAAQQRPGFPAITEAMVAQIVRAAMYSDGEIMWKGLLEKGASGAPAISVQPGPAKTA